MAMGTNCAVSLAELSLGFLEITNNLAPPYWFRYIDDGVGIHNKISRTTEDNRYLNQTQQDTLQKLNALDTFIKWTSEPISETCNYLDGCVRAYSLIRFMFTFIFTRILICWIISLKRPCTKRYLMT